MSAMIVIKSLVGNKGGIFPSVGASSCFPGIMNGRGVPFVVPVVPSLCTTDLRCTCPCTHHVCGDRADYDGTVWQFQWFQTSSIEAQPGKYTFCSLQFLLVSWGWSRVQVLPVNALASSPAGRCGSPENFVSVNALRPGQPPSPSP